MKWIRKPRFLLVYPLVAAIFLVSRTTERRLLFGFPVVLLGEFLRIWANGYVGHVKVNWTQRERGDAKIGQLITGGPYAYVRHPLYLGTFVIGVGFCIIVGNIWISLVALTFFLLVYLWRMGKEEEILREEWGDVFERYRRAVPRWLPSGRRYDQPHGRWSWKGIAASKELKTLVWVIVMVILLYFREEVFQEHELFRGLKRVKSIALLGLMGVLIAADLGYELSRRRIKRLQANGASP